MQSYLAIVKNVLDHGERKDNRTGIRTKAIAGTFFEHNMQEGFPLLTTKKIPFRLVASELEFFIKGITDKERLLARNNHIRDEWCSPDRVPYSHDAATQAAMKAERELGPIYGFQRRHFGAKYQTFSTNYDQQGVDQLKNLIQTLKKNPSDRRMIVSARNPMDLGRMALPPCHYGFQVTVINGKLNLLRNQRSVDIGLGLPFNIASYALLLHLLAKEAGLQEGKLVGFLADTHIYENHISALQEQLTRIPKPLPNIETKQCSSIFEREYTDTVINGYNPDASLSMAVAV
ncbi:thymidylate synthase [Candidatus Gracilibacteria bacterium]|nr:MAG: thymidylate synthase [Candidatus Gracilibacteria bacterium]